MVSVAPPTATSPDLLLFLQKHSMMDFAWLLHDMGASKMADLPLLNDKDLDSMGMKVVQIRRIRSETGAVDPVSLSPADREAAAPAAARGARSFPFRPVPSHSWRGVSSLM